jgi:DNA-binding IclR family transcriptional regulator
MKSDHHEPTRAPQAPTRVMHILEALAAEPGGMTLSRLSARLAAPKTTLLGTLRALEAEAYVANSDGMYRVGTATVSLAGLIASGSFFPASIRSILAALVAKSGETGIVGILSEDGSEVVYVDMIPSRSAIRFAAAVGSRRPLYCSAVGRAILAYQTEEFIENYLSQAPLLRHTERTVVDPALIRANLAEIRRAGHVESIGETTEGVGGAAAPVVDRLGEVKAAVAVAAPSERVIDRGEALEAMVKDAAQEASRALGYAAAYPPATDGMALPRVG